MNKHFHKMSGSYCQKDLLKVSSALVLKAEEGEGGRGGRRGGRVRRRQEGEEEGKGQEEEGERGEEEEEMGRRRERRRRRRKEGTETWRGRRKVRGEEMKLKLKYWSVVLK